MAQQAEAVEEIGRRSGERQSQAMELWAAVIYADQARRLPGSSNESEPVSYGGGSPPKDTFLASEQKDRIAKLKAAAETRKSERTEVQRPRDTVQVSAQPESQAAKPPAPPKSAEPPRPAQDRPQQPAVRETQRVQAAAEVLQLDRLEAAQAAEAVPVHAPVSTEAVEQRVQVASLAGADLLKPEEPDPAPSLSEADAALLAALREGGNPELAARAYVEVSTLSGVAGTLSARLLQGYVVAL
ncbi:MAG: hypothetical protein HY319_27355 [Armatimonadetes bacterium]|nr:hypothetical protein [Armatimonadota bacterium]